MVTERPQMKSDPTGPSTGTRFAACTILAHNYMSLARILADSFLHHHPEATFYVVVVDHPIEARLMRDERFTVVPITDIDFSPDRFEPMATMYDVTEFATSVKPFALRQLLRDHECVFYLDPDIKVYERLDPLIEHTFEGAWSLTPHCMQAIPLDGTSPTSREIMQSGVYNLGYVGVTRAALPMLDWWCDRLRRHAIIQPDEQLFTDQRWIDLAVPIFSPHIEQGTEYNVAYWNIDQRRLWRDGERYMVDDQPLRFFHFSGYDPKSPWWLSKYFPGDPRVLLSENPVLAELCDGYRVELLANREAAGATLPYGWRDATPGVPLSRSVRRYYRLEAIAADAEGAPLPPSPFEPGRTSEFLEWLTSEASFGPPLPRYLAALYEDRRDIRHGFPEVARGEVGRFRDWAVRFGRVEIPEINHLVGRDAAAPATTMLVDRGRSTAGIDLVGYLQAELGVGEAGRLAAAALEAADVPVAAIGCRRTLSRQAHPYEISGSAEHDVALLCVNADQVSAVRTELGSGFFDGRYVIGQWFWELEEFPEDQHGAFALVDEVWAATRHVHDAIARHAPQGVQVHHMPLPLVAPSVKPGVDRAFFGLDDRYTFLFNFDILSVFDRKNPLAVVEAFSRAFRPDEGPRLLIKVLNGQKDLNSLERLRYACRDRGDITVLDRYFDHDVSGALTAACDCYVSLHRAEGLGLTMSEAMALGKPVIATAYSGNVDFMTEATAALVPWTPSTVSAASGPYRQGARWAEPDIDEAAAAMRRFADDPDAGVRLGAAAKADLAARFSPQVTGARMRERLNDIRRTRHG